MTIYLYIKIHTKTKLKYFGKTTRNVNRYHGSGKHWQRHIKQHGVEHVKTLKVWELVSSGRSGHQRVSKIPITALRNM